MLRDHPWPFAAARGAFTCIWPNPLSCTGPEKPRVGVVAMYMCMCMFTRSKIVSTILEFYPSKQVISISSILSTYVYSNGRFNLFFCFFFQFFSLFFLGCQYCTQSLGSLDAFCPVYSFCVYLLLVLPHSLLYSSYQYTHWRKWGVGVLWSQTGDLNVMNLHKHWAKATT